MTHRTVAGEKIRLLRRHRRDLLWLPAGAEIIVPIDEAETIIGLGMAESVMLVYDEPISRKSEAKK